MAVLGLSLMPEPIYLEASADLFAAGLVKVLEWSFDMCWGGEPPHACQQLIQSYSDRGALLGHGVSFSLLTGARTTRQDLWIDYFQQEVKKYRYQHISEHFGMLNTEKFIQSAPLSMPLSQALLDQGIQNLITLKNYAKVPIGLENLGFAFSKEDALAQGQFISALLEAVDGFLVLDIHNVYCHMINFNLSFEQILETLPWHRVREIHMSGGSYRSIRHNQQSIYCDSHDAAVPEEVFLLLEQSIQRFNLLEAVIFERLGHTLHNDKEIEQFQNDFKQIERIIGSNHAATIAA